MQAQFPHPSILSVVPFWFPHYVCVNELDKGLSSREEGYFIVKCLLSNRPHLEVAAQASRPAGGKHQLSPGQRARQLKGGAAFGRGVFVLNKVLLTGIQYRTSN